jgi:hypothetical protein
MLRIVGFVQANWIRMLAALAVVVTVAAFMGCVPQPVAATTLEDNPQAAGPGQCAVLADAAVTLAAGRVTGNSLPNVLEILDKSYPANGFYDPKIVRFMGAAIYGMPKTIDPSDFGSRFGAKCIEYRGDIRRALGLSGAM